MKTTQPTLEEALFNARNLQRWTDALRDERVNFFEALKIVHKEVKLQLRKPKWGSEDVTRLNASLGRFKEWGAIRQQFGGLMQSAKISFKFEGNAQQVLEKIYQTRHGTKKHNIGLIHGAVMEAYLGLRGLPQPSAGTPRTRQEELELLMRAGIYHTIGYQLKGQSTHIKKLAKKSQAAQMERA